MSPTRDPSLGHSSLFGRLAFGLSWRYRAWRTRIAGMVLSRLPHDRVYHAAYFRMIDVEAAASAPAMAGVLVRRYRPASVVDIGCGGGALLAALGDLGVGELHGFDHARAARELAKERGLEVLDLDLEDPAASAPAPRCDLALSCEVAEHLPASHADRYVALLCRLGRVVVLTAATPAQGGTDHVNEQEPAYWIAKFATRGYRHDPEESRALSAEWLAAGAGPMYPENVMVFRP